MVTIGERDWSGMGLTEGQQRWLRQFAEDAKESYPLLTIAEKIALREAFVFLYEAGPDAVPELPVDENDAG